MKYTFSEMNPNEIEELELDNKEESQTTSTPHYTESQSPPKEPESDKETKKKELLPGDTVRKKIFLLFEDGSSSRPAFWISLFVLGVVLLSVVNFLLASQPQFWERRPPAIAALEIFCVVVFTVEYLARVTTAPVWWKWMLHLLAVLPFYLEMIVGAALSSIGVVRAIRLIRIFRIFKMGKFSKKLQLIVQTMKRSSDTILLLLILVFLSMVVLATLMFYAEQTVQYFDSEQQKWFRDIDDSESPFQSIPDSFWWAIVTMCRIPGYGQQYPISGLGKFIATIASVIGILVVAFPVAVIGQTFKDIWKEYTDQKLLKKKKKKLKGRLLIPLKRSRRSSGSDTSSKRSE